MAKLGEVATYVNGYAFKPQDWSDKGVPIIRIQDLTGNSYQANRYDGEYAPKYEVNDGDVLISWSASLGVYIWHGEKAVLNQHIFKVVFDKEKISKDFFVHQVGVILENAASNAHGATMKHLTKPVFDSLPFYLPPYEKQCEIAKVLNKMTDLIFLRKQQLARLDELIKARFVEMFGEPQSNQKNLVKIGEIGILSSGGTPSRTKPEYFNGKIRWYSAGELNDLYLKDSNEHISDDALNNSAAKLFEKDSLMIGMYDTAAFKMGILTEQSSSNQACANLKPNDRYNVIWLYHLFDAMKPVFLKERQGVRQKNLSLSKIKSFEVPSAPLSLQNEFAAFVERVDQQKQTVQQSLDKLELMKKALMQEYFG